MTFPAKSTWAGKAALAAMFLVLIVFVFQAMNIISALRISSPVQLQINSDTIRWIESYQKATDARLATLIGRSMFSIPLPPDPPPQKVSFSVIKKKTAPKKPAPPLQYGGPKIVGVAFDTVFFKDGQQLKVGEGNDEVEVVGWDPPWSILIKWRGSMYSVPFQPRDRIVLPDRTKQTSDLRMLPESKEDQVWIDRMKYFYNVGSLSANTEERSL